MSAVKPGGRLWRCVLGLTLLGYGLSACRPVPNTVAVQPTPAEVVVRPAPDEIIVQLAPMQMLQPRYGAYGEAAWLSDNQLVVEYDRFPQYSGYDSLLWSTQTDGRDLQSLNLPGDEQHQCTRVRFSNPMRSPNGRLAFVRDCSSPDGAYSHSALLDWDPHTGASQYLYSAEPPIEEPVRATIAPDLSQVVMSSYSGIEHKLYRLAEPRSSQIELGMARATRPDWSPDGQSIVFFGNRRLVGAPGPYWALQPYDLWLMPAGCQNTSGDCADDLQLLMHAVADPLEVNRRM